MSSSTSQDPRQVLNQFAGLAAAFVVGGAVLFGLIGAVSGDGENPQPSSAPTATAGATTSPSASAAATPSEESTAGQIVNPSATATPQPSDSGSPQPTETDSGDRIPPSDVSVQVLDGRLDGSSVAQDVYTRLGDLGHEQVAFVSSVRVYDDTTVFYSEGHEDAANQLAADNGWDVVRPASDVGLSDAANVHIVVGLDEG